MQPKISRFLLAKTGRPWLQSCMDMLMNGCQSLFVAAQKVDIWSCAVILYAIVFGTYPFDERERNFRQRIRNCQYTMPQVRPSSSTPAFLVPALLLCMAVLTLALLLCIAALEDKVQQTSSHPFYIPQGQDLGLLCCT